MLFSNPQYVYFTFPLYTSRFSGSKSYIHDLLGRKRIMRLYKIGKGEGKFYHPPFPVSIKSSKREKWYPSLLIFFSPNISREWNQNILKSSLYICYFFFFLEKIYIYICYLLVSQCQTWDTPRLYEMKEMLQDPKGWFNSSLLEIILW